MKPFLTFILVLTIVLAAVPVPAQVQVASGSGPLRVVGVGDQEILLELRVEQYSIEAFQQAGETYHRVHIPGMGLAAAPGDLQAPSLGALLGVPTLKGLRLEVVEAESEGLDGLRLAIQAEAGWEAVGNQLLDGVRPADVGELADVGQFHPTGPAVLGGNGYLRDQAVAQVQFTPVVQDASSGEVRLYRRVLARLSWDRSAASPDPLRVASPYFEPILAHSLLNYDQLVRPALAARGQTVDPIDISRQAAPLTSHALKLGVRADGLYQVTYGDLTGAGFNLSGLDPRDLQLANRGVEIPILVQGEGDGSFDPADTILFYGTAITDVYTTENVYWLTDGGSPGARMAAIDGTPGGASLATHFPVTAHNEVDSEYWSTMPNGAGQDHWFWGMQLSPNTAGLDPFRDFPVTLNNLSNAATSATVRVRMKGRTNDPFTNPDHHTQLSLNSAVIDSQTWDGFQIFDQQVAVSHSALQEGTNTVRVTMVGDTGASVDQAFVNWVEIDYWDTYVAESDALAFHAPSAGAWRYEVSAFSNATIQVFEISDPTAVAVFTNTVVGPDGGGGFQVGLQHTAGSGSRYLAVTPGAYLSPDSLTVDVTSDWGTPAHGADYILITHDDFYNAALNLANHRAGQGLRVVTVKTEDLYDEFNHGIFNPSALQDFLAYAYSNWDPPAPAFVALVGDAYQDYKDNFNTGTVNYVPSQLIETFQLGETSSDNWFVQLVGDDLLPDMFIGRLSAQSEGQVNTIISKITDYEQNPPGSAWNTDVLMVADDDESGFETISEDLFEELPFYYTPNRIYASQYPPGDMTADILSAIDAGQLLVGYTGHGNVDRWGVYSGGDIFRRSNVGDLNNSGKLPVVTVANCLNGFFTGPNSQVSMAEGFQREADGGALAVWAPTGLGYPTGHRALMLEFYKAIYQDDLYGLGEATTAAKVNLFSQNGFWSEMVETFVLFGDPASELALPPNYPYLEATVPGDGWQAVSRQAPVELRFNKPVDTGSVMLNVTGADGGSFVPVWDAEEKVVRFQHALFANGAAVTITVNAQDHVGNALGPGLVPSTWSFTVGEGEVFLPLGVR